MHPCFRITLKIILQINSYKYHLAAITLQILLYFYLGTKCFPLYKFKSKLLLRNAKHNDKIMVNMEDNIRHNLLYTLSSLSSELYVPRTTKVLVKKNTTDKKKFSFQFKLNWNSLEWLKKSKKRKEERSQSIIQNDGQIYWFSLELKNPCESNLLTRFNFSFAFKGGRDQLTDS